MISYLCIHTHTYIPLVYFTCLSYVVYNFQGLLREREQGIEDEKIWERKPVFYFMDPFFMVLANDHVKTIKKANKKGEQARNTAWDKALRFFNGYATSTVGPSIIDADYILLPTCIESAHWVLFLFSLKTFEVILLDSMNDSPYYPKESEIVVCLLV